MSNQVAGPKEFLLWDYSSTFFPLTTSRLMVERYTPGLQQHIQKFILDAADGCFQPQQRVYASKRDWFLRRTVKLDPVAEYFLYDLVFRNKNCFSLPPHSTRRAFGFQWIGEAPIPTIKSYAAFKKAVTACKHAYAHHAYFDVSAYFNHIYHHDLVRWFEEVGASAADVTLLGKYLREIASGRSIDCLPHGLYPAKMIGSSFLSFIEGSNWIRSSIVVRLMDDIWLFDDDAGTLISDVLRVQSLLGERGLTINDKKSSVVIDGRSHDEFPHDIDQMKVNLLRKRRELISSTEYGEENDAHPDELEELTLNEQEYLLGLLRGETVSEEDAELVLSLMKDNSVDVMEFLPSLVRDFPGLAKRLHAFCSDLTDSNEVVSVLRSAVDGDRVITEYQLFWFGKMAEDYLLGADGVGDLLHSMYKHEQATEITRAKILEISSRKFGLPDLREEKLRSGISAWPAWAAAVGARHLPRGQRNQLLKYFRKGSPINRLVGEFVESTL